MIDKLSIGKIKEIVAQRCVSPMGADLALGMEMQTEHETIVELMNQTKEFCRILEEEDFSVEGYCDVRNAMARIRISGTWIEQGELHLLRKSLTAINATVRFFASKPEGMYYYLQELSRDIFTFEPLLRKVDRIIDETGEIRDSASRALGEIRAEKRAAEAAISRHLSQTLRRLTEEGIIEAGTTAAMHDGRLAIPISPFHKKKVGGIVLGQSSTGKTIFVEPAEVVEADSRVRTLEAEEQREIARILTELTNEELRARIDEILFSIDYLGRIDFTRAKAIVAQDTDCTLPHLSAKPIVDWRSAVHPLLLLSHRESGKSVVPLDIKLDKEQRILIISGPNAGGKSVCLKTVGLVQTMAQMGMLVPMDAESTVGTFRKVLVDIGDEQSIENDLSTYSSHLQNMKSFLRISDDATMVLIDEFGGGTEPQIGAAIAIAILEELNRKHTLGIVTTHINALKHFAESQEGIVNGAMQYDRHHMEPLFSLEIGRPGSSFAVDIARKIGLQSSVIDRASEIVGKEYVDTERYLQDIARDKRYWEQKRQQIRIKEKRLEELESKYSDQLAGAAAERRDILRKAREEGQQLLRDANRQVEQTISEIRSAQADKEKTRSARSALEIFKERLAADGHISESDVDRKLERIRERQEKKRQGGSSDKESKPEQKKAEVIAVGSNVRVKGQTQIGTVEKLNTKEAVCSFAGVRMAVKLTNLEIAKSEKKEQKVKFGGYKSDDATEILRNRTLNFKRQIDVRGMRADEAIQAVAYYVDDAVMVQAGEVRILHGTGTGALRMAIREFLSGNPSVRSYRDEHVDFGGAGITVIEIK